MKGLKKKIVSYSTSFLTKKTGFLVSILGVHISFSSIKFHGIMLTKNSVRIEIDNVKLNFRVAPQFFQLVFGDLGCYYVLPEQTQNDYPNSNYEELDEAYIQKKLIKFNSLFTKKYSKFWAFLKIECKLLKIYYKNHALPTISLTNFSYRERKITFQLNKLGKQQSQYRVLLRFNRHKILYSLNRLFTSHSDEFIVPHLMGKIGIGTDNQITFTTYTKTLILHHKQIARQAITLDALNISLIIDQFNDKLALNPASTIQFNKINLELKCGYNYKEGLFSLLFYLTAKVEHLIQLIPDLKDGGLNDFSSEGEICIGISLGFLWHDPLSYKFKLDYNFDEFKMISSGVDLSYLKGCFNFESKINPAEHRVLKVLARPRFAKSKIMLSKIIQYSEDPNFYQHNGIDNFNIGVAIANNLSRKKFFKGASTLTMQLVKNLFLTEEKSVMRKLEEVVLTIMLENHFKISKQRILSIYLQIIEFGPNVYGVEEAATFYFNKTVEELTLMECLTLSYIIPRPRFFLEALRLGSEQLNNNLTKHIENKVATLISKQMISNDDLLNLNNKINFSNIGELRLTKLNIPNLRNLFAKLN